MLANICTTFICTAATVGRAVGPLTGFTGRGEGRGSVGTLLGVRVGLPGRGEGRGVGIWLGPVVGLREGNAVGEATGLTVGDPGCTGTLVG